MQNINECLLGQALIQRHKRQTSRIVLLHFNGATLPELRNVIQSPVEDGGNILRSQISMQGTREIEKAGNQRAEAVGFGRNVSGELGGEWVGVSEFLGEHFG